MLIIRIGTRVIIGICILLTTGPIYNPPCHISTPDTDPY